MRIAVIALAVLNAFLALWSLLEGEPKYAAYQAILAGTLIFINHLWQGAKS